MKRMQGHDSWKASFSVRESAKCNFKIKLKYRKMFLSHEMKCICNAKTDFHVLELFCRASHVRASMHRITSFRASKNTNAVFRQLSKWRECKAKDAEKLLSQWEKGAKMQF